MRGLLARRRRGEFVSAQQMDARLALQCALDHVQARVLEVRAAAERILTGLRSSGPE